MSEEQEEEQFSEDHRVQYVGERLCRMLQVQADAWEHFVNLEKNKSLFTMLFEARVRLLFFSSTAANEITVKTEVSSMALCVCLHFCI